MPWTLSRRSVGLQSQRGSLSSSGGVVLGAGCWSSCLSSSTESGGGLHMRFNFPKPFIATITRGKPIVTGLLHSTSYPSPDRQPRE